MNDCKWPLQVNILVLMWPCRNEIFLSLCIFIMLMISNSWAQLGLSKHLWPFLTNHEYMYTIGNHISAYSLSSKKGDKWNIYLISTSKAFNIFLLENCWFACILYTKSFIYKLFKKKSTINYFIKIFCFIYAKYNCYIQIMIILSI